VETKSDNSTTPGKVKTKTNSVSVTQNQKNKPGKASAGNHEEKTPNSNGDETSKKRQSKVRFFAACGKYVISNRILFNSSM
jgi:hypothetical protein